MGVGFGTCVVLWLHHVVGVLQEGEESGELGMTVFNISFISEFIFIRFHVHTPKTLSGQTELNDLSDLTSPCFMAFMMTFSSPVACSSSVGIPVNSTV